MIMVNRYLPSVLALALLFPPVHAAQPPDVVVSDASGNTAGGTGALSSLQSGYNNSAFGGAALSNDTSGFHNTAMGNGAASAITSGFGNTAVGSQALNSKLHWQRVDIDRELKQLTEQSEGMRAIMEESQSFRQS